MTEVLVVGATGFVGAYLRDHFQATGTSSKRVEGLVYADLRVPESTSEAISKLRPAVVINAAGIGFEECERDPTVAAKVNAEGVLHVAKATNAIGASLVHLSTDYVFDGCLGNYSEEDPVVNPLSIYGRTKRQGELHAIESGGVVLRLSLVYELSYSGRKITLPEFVRRSLAGGTPVRVAADQRMSPTYIRDIPRAIRGILAHTGRGVFHIGSPGGITRYEFCILVAHYYGLPLDLIIPISMKDDHFYDGRPKDSSLNVSKLSSLVDLTDARALLEGTQVVDRGDLI